MLSSRSRNWSILALAIISILSILSHRYGLFQIELDLISPQNNTAVFPSNSDNIKASLIVEGSTIILTCDVMEIQSLNFCSFSILLSKSGEFSDYVTGKDFSSYHTLDMDIDYDGPAENPNLRISFRNSNPAYLKDGDYTSLKYNSMIFEPLYNSTLTELALSSFSVEEWWVTQHEVNADNAKLDFSNIAYIEVLPHIISQVDRYEIEIHRFALVGEVISEAELLLVILVIWSIVVVSLVIQNNNNLIRIATTDLLTGSLNRHGMSEWVNSKISSPKSRSSLCMLYIDLDDFKSINDSYGHYIGDELLHQFCVRVNEIITRFKKANIKYQLGRLAGDEFAVAFTHAINDDSYLLAESLIEGLSQPIDLLSCSLKVNISIGISAMTDKTKSFDDLMKDADMAMYFAKRNGKNQIKVFDESIAHDTFYRKDISEKIKFTIDSDGFYLNYMPIYCSATHKMLKVEVLLRTGASYLKGVGPDIFIPIAEEFYLIHDIDLWVIERTFKVISENRELFYRHQLGFCINISAIELHHESFPKKFKALVEKYDVNPALITLEITETSLVDVNEKSIASLNELRRMGIELALDDFGTGYTAFNQLIKYPVNCLKIDKSFLDELSEENKIKGNMIKAMLSIADSYELETVAEGVETQEQLDFVTKNNCDMVQGYLFSKPVELEQLVSMCSQQH
jgi:diguanylate cyclase (GGDEF)-like protein